MFLFKHFFLLVACRTTLSVDLPVGSPFGVKYSTTCVPDEKNVLVVNFENERDVPLNFTLFCQHESFSLIVSPNSKGSLPATFEDGIGPGICKFEDWTDSGKKGVYLLMVQSRQVVFDDYIYCDTGVIPSRPVLRYKSDFSPDHEGIFSVTLLNPEVVPLNYYVQCWNTWFAVELDPNTTMSFNTSFYRGDKIDYGKAVYNGREDDMCVFMPWTNDGSQYLFMESTELNQEYLIHYVNALRSPPKDPPSIGYSSDCRPDRSGKMELSISNLKNESVTFLVACRGRWTTFVVGPYASTTFPFVYARGYDYEYLPGACVAQQWQEFMGDDQAILFFAENEENQFRSDFFFCPMRETPDYRFSTTCEADVFGFSYLRVENNVAVPSIFVAKCLFDIFKYEIPPLSVLNLPTLFYSGEREYPPNTCVMKPIGDGKNVVYVLESFYRQYFVQQALYCDNRVDPPKPVFVYDVLCQPSIYGTNIRLKNNENETMTFTVYCNFGTKYEIPVSAQSVVDFPVALHYGKRDYANATYAGVERPICVMTPMNERNSQAVYLTAQKVSQKEYEGMLEDIVYCDGPTEPNPPNVSYVSNCQPDASDIVYVDVVNNENGPVFIAITCANDRFEFTLSANSMATVPVMYFRGSDYYYPPDICIFKSLSLLYYDDGVLHVYEETPDFRFRQAMYFCPKGDPETLHGGYFSSTCQANPSGVVSIPLLNSGPHWVTFTAQCLDRDYQVRVAPRSEETFKAVFYRGEAADYPKDVCVFSPRTEDVQSILFVIYDTVQDFTIHFLHCGVGFLPVAPLRSIGSDCRPNDNGQVVVNLKNPSDKVMKFSVRCFGARYQLNVGPQSSLEFLAEFYTGGNPDDSCVFTPWSHLGWQALIVESQTADERSIPHYLFCKGEIPDDPPQVQVESSCIPDESGVILIQLKNRDQSAVTFSVACKDDWYSVKVPPGSSSTFPAVLFDGDDHDYPPNTCIFLDLTDFFMVDQYIWVLSQKAVGKYTEENLFCKRIPSKTSGPILSLRPQCGSTLSAPSSLELRTDVPAYAKAKCRNGDKIFTTTDYVSYTIETETDQSYSGDSCLLFKKAGSNTFTVDVEVGWGEKDSQLVLNQETRTVSCAYDAHGKALSSKGKIADWFLNPLEMQTLLGGLSDGVFSLKVIDILDNEIDSDHIPIGRKIRLRATVTSGRVKAFRALSCEAVNGNSNYSILRAGCGDGLIFEKKDGFTTLGNAVYSPYFEAFKLAGDNWLEFQCRFTTCRSNCDGDSCGDETWMRSYRSAPTDSMVKTRQFYLQQS